MKAKRFISTILAVILALGVVIKAAQAQQPVPASSKTDGSADAASPINLPNLIARVWRSRR